MKSGSFIKPLVVVIALALAVFFSITPLTQNINLGLDLQGGVQVLLKATSLTEGQAVTDDEMNQFLEVMRKRVDAFGLNEPVIQREGTDRLIIELAGIDDPESAIATLGRTAKLEFRDPSGEVIITGSDLANATAQIDPTTNENEIVLAFNAEGTKKFGAATARLVGQPINIYLDDQLIQSPNVKEPIMDGNASISGGFATYEEAANSATLLRSGALPVGIEVLSKTIIGPSLGSDSLDKSINAAVIGLILLAVFIIAYYRLPGLIAAVSLVLYSLILLWVLNLLGATLTLPGIAGFILSIGVAVDANIIIYERLKEELFSGKSLNAAIDAGFKRAFATIFDSNATTLIAALVLFKLGSGSIQGFAATLSIGIVASMFTAITFTRFMLRNTANVELFHHKSYYGLTKKKREFNFNFIGKKKIWYIISLAIIIPGMFSLGFRGLNMGIDFAGGNIYQLQFANETSLSQVTDIVDDYVSQSPSIQETKDNQFLIRTSVMTEDESNTMLADMEKQLGTTTIMRNESIGAVVGSELQKNAIWAVFWALIAMLIYVSFRFKPAYAVSAVISLIHDVLVMIAIFSFLKIEVNSPFIAACLTVVGYSINNAIVVFDRVRENINYKVKDEFPVLINKSINQTMGRSINTIVAVLILLFCLLFLGGETTKTFILALVVGIVAGAYSSMFIAGPLLADLSKLPIFNKSSKMRGRGNSKGRAKPVATKKA